MPYLILSDDRRASLKLRDYLTVVKLAKAAPDYPVPEELREAWGETGADIVAAFRRRVQERINAHVRS